MDTTAALPCQVLLTNTLSSSIQSCSHRSKTTLFDAMCGHQTPQSLSTSIWPLLIRVAGLAKGLETRRKATVKGLHSRSTHQGFCATPEQTGDDAGPPHTSPQPPGGGGGQQQKTRHLWDENEHGHQEHFHEFHGVTRPYHLIRVQGLAPP